MLAQEISQNNDGNVKYDNIKQNQEIITSLFLSDFLNTKSEK